MNRAARHIIKQEPNFNVLRAALMNETPDYLPFYELFVDREMIEAVLERPLPVVSRGIFPLEKKITIEERHQYVDSVVEYLLQNGI